MESVFQNPGLSHIGKKILKSLDFKTLTSLRLVCKSANNQGEDLASGITLNELQGLLEKFTIARSLQLAQEYRWKRFLNFIFNNWSESINDWPESNGFMNLYLKEILSRDTKYIRYGWKKVEPIYEFVRYGNKAMVEFILYYELHPINDYEIGLLLEEVDSCGHKDICEIFEKFKVSNSAPPNSPQKSSQNYPLNYFHNSPPMSPQNSPPPNRAPPRSPQYV